MACLTPEQIELLVRNELDPTDSAETRGHVDRCSDCRAKLDECLANEELLHELTQVSPLDPLQRADGSGLASEAVEAHGATVDPPPGPPSDSFTGYRMIREIHRGGQGVVYQAVQNSTQRKVAIKVMKEGPFAGPTGKARFEREIQILGLLKHPNVVAIHDSGTAAGSHFFVMDYISGQPLDVYMQSRERTIEETLRLFTCICGAVNAAHLRGIIHRDLKPGNIRIDENDQPHVLDFGLAKVALGDSRASAMTMTGEILGSLPWTSPEQAEGVPEKVDIRSDVYALGVILYQMLTSRFPYDVVGNVRDVLDNILKAEPVKPSTIRRQVNDEVETIVLKCLKKERAPRYQSAGELARDIGHYLVGEPIDAKRASGWYVVRKSLRRYRVAVGVAAAFVLLLGGSTIALWNMYHKQSRALELAEQAREAEETQRELAERREAEAIAARESEKKQRELAQQQGAEAERQRVLANQRYEVMIEMMRFADIKRLADAEAAADDLWPAHPERIEAMEKWLSAKAAPLRDNIARHEAALAALRELALGYDHEQQKQDRETNPKYAELTEKKQRLPKLQKELAHLRAEELKDAEEKTKRIVELEESIADTENAILDLEEAVRERRTWIFSDEETQWRHDTLAGLMHDLRKFVDPDPNNGTIASVEDRLAFARVIEEQSVTGAEPAAMWAEAIVDIAKHDTYDGMVLIPGGTFWMGSQKDDPTGRNYDPQANCNETPPHEIALDPFFISKYEMTQSQWKRFAGTNPSRYGPTWKHYGDPRADKPIHVNKPWNPVEQVSWSDCKEMLWRFALVLPTEAQWEYAARGGTDTVWWTGNEKESIGAMAAGNLADQWTKGKIASLTWKFEEWLEDGFIAHAPVGSFSPNGFGLHDTIGNVWEWCRDEYGDYENEVSTADALRKPTGTHNRVYRGGCFGNSAFHARSAKRNNHAFDYTSNYVGVRPAREISE